MSKSDKRIIRKDLRSMHQDLHNWSVVLNNEETKLNQFHNLFEPSSIHKSISSFSSTYRPLSMSFQKWKSDKKKIDNGIDMDDIHCVHYGIQLLASKLHYASSLQLNVTSNNEQFLNECDKNDTSVKKETSVHENANSFPIASPAIQSPVFDNESIDDPFSAKLDIILDSEEQESVFKYDSTPPNTPLLERLAFEEVFEEQKSKFQQVTESLQKLHESTNSLDSGEYYLETKTIKDCDSSSKDISSANVRIEDIDAVAMDHSSDLDDNTDQRSLSEINHMNTIETAMKNTSEVDFDEIPGSVVANEMIDVDTEELPDNANEGSINQNLNIETKATASEFNPVEGNDFAIAKEVIVSSMLKTAAITELTHNESNENDSTNSSVSENNHSSTSLQSTLEKEKMDQDSFMQVACISQLNDLSNDNVVLDKEEMSQFHEVNSEVINLEESISLEAASHENGHKFLNDSTSNSIVSNGPSDNLSECSCDADLDVCVLNKSKTSDFPSRSVVNTIQVEDVNASDLQLIKEDRAYVQFEKVDDFVMENDVMKFASSETPVDNSMPVNSGSSIANNAILKSANVEIAAESPGPKAVKSPNVVIVEEIVAFSSDHKVPLQTVLIEEANSTCSNPPLGKEILVEDASHKYASNENDQDSIPAKLDHITNISSQDELNAEESLSESTDRERYTEQILPVTTIVVQKVALKPLNVPPLVRAISIEEVSFQSSDYENQLSGQKVLEEETILPLALSGTKQPTLQVQNLQSADSMSKFDDDYTAVTSHDNSSTTLITNIETSICKPEALDQDADVSNSSFVFQNEVSCIKDEHISIPSNGKKKNEKVASEKNSQGHRIAEQSHDDIARKKKNSFVQKKKVFENASKSNCSGSDMKVVDKAPDAPLESDVICGTPTSPLISHSLSSTTFTSSVTVSSTTALYTPKPFSATSNKRAPVVAPIKLNKVEENKRKFQSKINLNLSPVSPSKPKPPLLPKPQKSPVKDKVKQSASSEGKVESHATSEDARLVVTSSITELTSENMPIVPPLPNFDDVEDAITENVPNQSKIANPNGNQDFSQAIPTLPCCDVFNGSLLQGDFTSPLPFSSTAKKSSFRPIRFNQPKNPTRKEETSENSQTPAIPTAETILQPAEDTSQQKTAKITPAVPTVEVDQQLAEATSEQKPAKTPENEDICGSDPTLSKEHFPPLPESCQSDALVLEKSPTLSESEDMPTKMQSNSEVEPHEIETLESPDALTSNAKDHCVEVVEESPSCTSINDLEVAAVVPNTTIDHSVPESTNGSLVPETIDPVVPESTITSLVPETTIDPVMPKSTIAYLAPVAAENDRVPTSTTTAKPTNYAMSPPDLQRLNVDEQCDSMTSDGGGGERSYTDDDMDDMESIDNFLGSSTNTKLDDSSTDNLATTDSTTNARLVDSSFDNLETTDSPQHDHNVADSSDTTTIACSANAITNSNLPDTEGTLKPTNEDFVLPPPPEPQQENVSHAYFRTTLNSVQKKEESAVPASTWTSDPDDLPLPPPPEDFTAPVSPTFPASPQVAPSDKPKGFRSVARPVSKDPSSCEVASNKVLIVTSDVTPAHYSNGVNESLSFHSSRSSSPTMLRSGYVTLLRDTRKILIKPSASSNIREETTTSYSLSGKPFPTSHDADVKVTSQEQLPAGAVYQTTTEEGEVLHTETYYPASDQGDPKSAVLERTKTTTIVQAPHHQGIGPVTDSGVPYALRTSVDDSKHWYKNMFKQMHKVETPEETSSAAMETRSYSADSSHPRHTSTEVSKPKKVGRITDYQPAQPYVVENEPQRSSSLEEFTKMHWSDYFEDVRKPKTDSGNEAPQHETSVKSPTLVKSPKPTSTRTYTPSYFTNSKQEEDYPPEQKRMIPTKNPKSTSKMQPTKAPEAEMRLPARGKYDFAAQTTKEYPLKKGQTVIITRQVDNNWYMVQSVDGVRGGIVPVSYIEVISGASPEKPLRNGQARAKFNFDGSTKKELSFKKGDEITLVKKVDDNWYKGKLAGVVGILPAVYIEVIMEPETESKKGTGPVLKQTPRVVTSSHSRQSPALSQASSDEPDERECKQRAAFLANSVVKTISPLHSRETSVHREDFIDAVLVDGTSNAVEEKSKNSQQPDLNIQEESKVIDFTELDQVVEALSQENKTLPSLHPPAATNNRLSPQTTVHAPSIPSIPSYPSSSTSPQSLSPRPASPTSVDYGKVIGTYVALYAYDADNEDELELMPGDIVKVVETCDDGWYVGTCQRTGVFGTFPGNYVSPTNT